MERLIPYTDPADAAMQLIEILTGLDPGLIRLIGNDQVNDSTVLGQPTPPEAAPIITAAQQADGPLFRQIYSPATATGASEPARASTAPAASHIAAILALLLNSRSARYSPSRDSLDIDEQLDALVANEILAIQNGAYRASEIALYSCFRAPPPPPRH